MDLGLLTDATLANIFVFFSLQLHLQLFNLDVGSTTTNLHFCHLRPVDWSVCHTGQDYGTI